MDWQLTCRVCLETGDMVSLFDWDENNEQLSDKYTYCCGVKVTKNDSLPTLICLNCVDRLTYSYQFKQQCLSSNETLKECLEEFEKTSQAVSSNSKTTETETITIKQENGLLLQYELPIEHGPETSWSHTLGKAAGAVLTKAPAPRTRGRRRKYPNEQGEIDLSPYQRKKPKESDNEPESLTSLLASGSLDLKEEQTDGEAEVQAEQDDEPFGADFLDDDDPEFQPDESELVEKKSTGRKRGRPRVRPPKKEKPAEDGEDVLLRETIMAFSEPIPDHLLNPKPKKKYQSRKKKYNYGKTHTCETCGSSFTSNASLQAHIRRHLGIKPFVCRLHMGLRPYQCSLCGKAFTYSYVLSNHMLTHTGEKKYQCGPCNKKFTKAHHLKYHNKVHHKELYLQQQLEAENKKMQQKVNSSASLSGILTGKIVDGTLHIVQASEQEGDHELEHEGQMQLVVEEEEDNSDRETTRAVADMQSVVLDAEFGMDDEEEIKGM